MNRYGMVVLACLALLAGPSWAQPAPADEGGGAELTEEQKQAQAYNEFLEEINRQSANLPEQMTKEFELSDEQVQKVTELLRKHTGQFMDLHGRETFDLSQKVKALAKYAAESGMRQEDVDPELMRDLADAALPLLDAFQEQVKSWANDVNGELDQRQQALLAREQMKLETGIRAGRMQIRKIAGREAEEDSASPGGAGGAPGGDSASPGNTGTSRQARLARASEDTRKGWQRYVDRFCLKYSLDEVQKVRAYDVLRVHLNKLDQLRKDAEAARLAVLATTPATMPASAPAGATQPVATKPSRMTMGEFRTRLKKDPAADPSGVLFEHMVKELDVIPTLAQRKLADETNPAEPTPATTQP